MTDVFTNFNCVQSVFPTLSLWSTMPVNNFFYPVQHPQPVKFVSTATSASHSTPHLPDHPYQCLSVTTGAKIRRYKVSNPQSTYSHCI